MEVTQIVFKQSPKGEENGSTDQRKACHRQRKQKMWRCRGRTVPGVLEKPEFLTGLR